MSFIAGYAVPQPWKPRLWLEIDAGSGDRHPNDGKLETFNPMFPKGTYFNDSSLTSWANLLLFRAGITVQPTQTTSLSGSVSGRWRQTTGDAVYVQPYTPLLQTGLDPERRVGEGFQLDASWRANRHLTVSAQALHQAAGPAIRRAGGSRADFATLIAQLRF